MEPTDDLMHEAHDLGEAIRRRRASASVQRGHDPAAVRAMEVRLASLWTAIRVARAGAGAADLPPPSRRTRPKWE